MSATESTQQNIGTNANYTGASVIEIRLETQAILDQIEAFLRGAQLVPHEVEGEGLVMKSVSIGEAKCSDVGVQSVMAFCQSIINPAVVQGNLTQEQYSNYVYETNVSLVQNIVINTEKWGICDEDIEVICDFVMSLVQPFMSRTIENGERNSYETTLKSSETNTVQAKRLPFGQK